MAFVIDGAPEVMPLAVDLHKNLVQMPAPTARPHPLDTPLPDLRREHRAEPVPPEPLRLVADIDAPFVQEVLDIAQRQRKANIHHDCQADDLRRRLEVAKRGALRHCRRLTCSLPRLKTRSFDSAFLDAAIRLLTQIVALHSRLHELLPWNWNTETPQVKAA